MRYGYPIKFLAKSCKVESMSGQLTKTDGSQSSRALELLSRGLGGIESKGALIKGLLPGLHLPFHRPPPNIIRVMLDEKSSHSSPGEEIRGIVRLMVSEPIAVKDITISLIGIAKAKAVRPSGQSLKSIYRTEIQIVNETLRIDTEAAILVPKRYEWPFEFAIPRTCTIPELPFDEKTRRFNSNLTQPLPPLFADKNLKDIRSKCSVGYHVAAKLVSKRKTQIDVQHQVPISVLANDAKALMASDSVNTMTKRCNFKFRSTMPSSPPTSPEQLTPREEDQKLSLARKSANKASTPNFRTRFKNSFMPFTLLSNSFNLDADLPRSGRLSEPLPITLKLSWQTLTSSQKTSSQLLISLTSVTISLISRTLMRAIPEDASVGAGFVLATGSLHQIWRSKPVVIAELKEPFEALPDKLDLSKHIFVRPHHFQPAFRTFNVAREYVLHVVCKLESNGESFEARYEVENFAIVAEGDLGDDFEEMTLRNKGECEALKDLDSDEEDNEMQQESPDSRSA